MIDGRFLDDAELTGRGQRNDDYSGVTGDSGIF
jgi:hypothetical protein